MLKDFSKEEQAILLEVLVRLILKGEVSNVVPQQLLLERLGDLKPQLEIDLNHQVKPSSLPKALRSQLLLKVRLPSGSSYALQEHTSADCYSSRRFEASPYRAWYFGFTHYSWSEDPLSNWSDCLDPNSAKLLQLLS
jgi:hypothetical protein